MNKKLLLVSILAVIMLVAISFSTIVSSNTNTTEKKKDSPLFGIRTKLAIGERLETLKKNIKSRFVGERVFFLPFRWFGNRNDLTVTQRFDKRDTTNDNTCYRHSVICTCNEKCEFTLYFCWTIESFSCCITADRPCTINSGYCCN